MRRLTALSRVPRRCFSCSSPRRETIPLAFQRHDGLDTKSAGNPIILMHGLFGSQRNNRTISKALARDLNRPVYNIDLRNHGDSPHSPTHTYLAMAEDVEAFISSHSLSKPLLIGHSMGAKIAMALALRQPTAYSGLIPVDNSPIDAALKSDFGNYVKAMKEIADTPSIQKQKDADKVLEKYEKDISIRQFLLMNFVRNKAGNGESHFRIPLHTLAKALPDMADFPFKDPDEARYEGPTLIVRGTQSHYVADETLPLIGRFFPKFELLSLDSGHWVMAERFEEFRRGVVDWVGRCVDDEK